MTRLLAGLAALALAAIATFGFGPLPGTWTLVLFILTYWRADIGIALLFLTCSIDLTAPLLPGIIVSYSELQLAGGLVAYVANEKRSELDYLHLKRCLPFLVAVLISGIVNIQLYKILPHGLRASEIFLAAFLAHNAIRHRGYLFARVALASSCSFFVAIAFMEFATQFTRPQSYFGNPNQLSAYLGALAPFLLTFSIFEDRNRHRYLWSLVYLISVVGILISGSRIALVALIVSSLAVGLISLRYFSSPGTPVGRVAIRMGKQMAVVGVIAIALFLLTLSQPEFRQRIAVRAGIDGGQSSLRQAAEARLAFMRLGYQVWRRNPVFGIGPGRWDDVVEARRAQLKEAAEAPFTDPAAMENLKAHVHNLYLQLAVDYGLAGALAFLGWMGMMGWCLSSRYLGGLKKAASSRKASDPTVSLDGRAAALWPIAGIGLVLGFVIHNLGDATFPSLALELGFLFGFVSPQATKSLAAAVPRHRATRSGPIADAPSS